MKSSSIDEFVSTVIEYCQFADSNNNNLDEIRSLLLRLIFHIPAIHSAQHEYDHEGDSVTSDKSEELMKRFSKLKIDYYQMVFSPLDVDQEDEPVMGILADDLTDIYIDLYEGLSNYKNGHQGEAYFDWSNSYRHHWGSHAINALKAIETYINEN
jgi:hypothetical protein